MQLRAMGSGAVPSGPTQLMMSIGLGKKPDEPYIGQEYCYGVCEGWVSQVGHRAGCGRSGSESEGYCDQDALRSDKVLEGDSSCVIDLVSDGSAILLTTINLQDVVHGKSLPSPRGESLSIYRLQHDLFGEAAYRNTADYITPFFRGPVQVCLVTCL